MTDKTLKKYDLSREDFDQMLAGQNGKCPICLRNMKTPCIDHHHKSGKVRGLLCRRCNRGLGFFREFPEDLKRAATYLETRNP